VSVLVCLAVYRIMQKYSVDFPETLYNYAVLLREELLRFCGCSNSEWQNGILDFCYSSFNKDYSNYAS